MPRTGKGGGPGPTNQGGPVQSPKVAPGTTTYGERDDLEAAQRAVPIPDEREGFEQRLEATMETARQMRSSGPGLRAASQRPGEPLTAGLSSGRGPGPEALQGVQRNLPSDADAQKFARFIPALEAIAAKPGTSVRARNYVRMLRGTTRVDYRTDEG